MRYYKKKSRVDATGYVPQAGSQAAMIEARLSHTEWRTAEEITEGINRNEHIVDLARVRQHLGWHVNKSRRLESKEM